MTELYLYVAEYFVGHNTCKLPIYASNLEDAVISMNDYYNQRNLGNNHKTIQRNIVGIHVNGEYYPPTKQES